KKCKTESQTHFKSFALETYADNAGLQAATPLLVRAMDDEFKSYRMGAINYTIEKSGPSGPWVSELAKTKNPEVQAEIIFLLASLEDKSTITSLRKYLENPDAGVRSEAVSAIARLVGSATVEDMVLHILKYPEEPDLTAAKSALLSVAGAKEIKSITGRISGADYPAKVVFMEILAEKGSPEFFTVLMDNARDENQDVRYAAIKGLKSVVTSQNLGTLLDFLDEDHDSLSTAEIQAAIIQSVQLSDDKTKQLDIVLSAMEEAGDIISFIPVLAGVGGEKSLITVKNIYANRGNKTKEQALQALISWSDDAAIPVLLDICKNTGSEDALNGYIRQVDKSSHTPDQKL
ncbi:MAG: HEAT repeat domain-containing protein, partial [Bacteroidales bacterium]|nr:HEAT repeat domain-containing protein [Bacteroidales bacterium]